MWELQLPLPLGCGAATQLLVWHKAFHNWGKGRGICPCGAKSAPAGIGWLGGTEPAGMMERNVGNFLCERESPSVPPVSLQCSSSCSPRSKSPNPCWKSPGSAQPFMGHRGGSCSCPAHPGKVTWKIQALGSASGDPCQLSVSGVSLPLNKHKLENWQFILKMLVVPERCFGVLYLISLGAQLCQLLLALSPCSLGVPGTRVEICCVPKWLPAFPGGKRSLERFAGDIWLFVPGREGAGAVPLCLLSSLVGTQTIGEACERCF